MTEKKISLEEAQAFLNEVKEIALTSEEKQKELLVLIDNIISFLDRKEQNNERGA